jgi:hypothetical protein
MRTMLSILIPIWIGTALGAAVSREVPSFWWVWAVGGVIIAILTTIYVTRGSSSSEKSNDRS